MQLVHHVFAAFVEQRGENRDCIADTADDLILFSGRRTPQHVVEHVILVAGMADTETEAPELVAQMRDQVLESVVPARTTAELEAHAPDRQIEVVVRDQHLVEVDLAVIEETLHRKSATIHERERLEDPDLLFTDANLRELALEAALLSKLAVALARERIREPEARVVTRERVFRPGIAQTDDES